jgi:hypothetical protein
MFRFVLLVWNAGSGSETSTMTTYRFTTIRAAEQARDFFLQFTPHVLIIEDV